MPLVSSLEDFSLAELFTMIDQGRKSGCLTVYAATDPKNLNNQTQHNIWFRHGRVLCAANRLDGQGLISKITEKGWLSQRVIEKLSSRALDTPLGLALKSQGALQSEQLNTLFHSQIVEIYSLFELHIVHFELDGKAKLPSIEMTGLSSGSMEVALAALRVLKNWQNMNNLLPDSLSTIKKIIVGKPQLVLNSLELQIWELANGTISLEEIAQQLSKPISKIQQATFRLILAGIVEEITLLTSIFNPTNSDLNLYANAQPVNYEDLPKRKVSRSFLQNITGFF